MTLMWTKDLDNPCWTGFLGVLPLFSITPHMNIKVPKDKTYVLKTRLAPLTLENSYTVDYNADIEKLQETADMFLDEYSTHLANLIRISNGS